MPPGGVTLPAAGGVGGTWVVAGFACGGTVGEAVGAVALTATRRLSISEFTSSTEKLARPRGSLTMTFAPSPMVTVTDRNWLSSARRILRATATSSVPESTDTVISTGSVPSGGVTRNSSSPLEDALPLGRIFHVSDSGVWLAAEAAGANKASNPILQHR